MTKLSTLNTLAPHDDRPARRAARREGCGRRGRRGSGLIETLIAIEILTLAMIGILQLFSLSVLVNGVAAARTVMIFKAQQVVECMRLAVSLGSTTAGPPQQLGLMTAMNASTIPTTLFTGNATTSVAPVAGTYQLPYTPAELAVGSPNFWGLNGANIVEVGNGPFRLTVTVTGASSPWTVTVTCFPQTAAPAVGDGASGGTFLGGALALTGKRIDYVAQIR